MYGVSRRRLPEQTAPVRWDRMVMELVVLRRDRRVRVQQVDPFAVGRKWDVDELGRVGEVEHHDEPLQPSVRGVAPAMVDDQLPSLVDPVTLRREAPPAPVVAVRVEIRGAQATVLVAEAEQEAIAVLKDAPDGIIR